MLRIGYLALTTAVIAFFVFLLNPGTGSETVHSQDPLVSQPQFRKAAAFAESRPQPASAIVENGAIGRQFAGFGDAEESATLAHQTNEQASEEKPVSTFLPEAMPTPALSFDGLRNEDNVNEYNLLIMPPDMNGDVGPGHYVQIANSLFRVYDKSGNAVSPPMRISSLFSPLGTVCSTRNDGLPVVLYDSLADRWIISQICSGFAPFRQMIAVSKTGDPAGEYFAYEFAMPSNRLNDFPKLGVWPDAYYMSTDEFFGSDYVGTGMFAFDREKMLTGDPAAGFIYFNTTTAVPIRRKGMLPVDLDGLAAPSAGTPGIFASYTATEYGDNADALRLFDFHADFDVPANSTFTETPESPVAVAPFDPTSPDGRADIAQPPPGDFLDSQSDRINYRLSYRKFDTHESLVVNQTVRLTPVGTTYRAGVRVYELRRNGSTFSVHSQGTLGDAGASRWVGSAALDHHGNLAVQYNYVNEEKKPSILYSGRRVTDPADSFLTEAALADGTGVQRAFGWRWGEYSGMNVDPVDDCTFWMTNSYYSLASQQWSEMGWLTRIGKFKFSECTPAPRGKLGASLRSSATNTPLPNAKVLIFPGGSAANTPFTRFASASGTTPVAIVPPGQYLAVGSFPGYRSKSAIVNVINDLDATTFVDLHLDPIPVFELSDVSIISESCRINGAPETGETVTANVTIRNSGAAVATRVNVSLLAEGGISEPSAAQSYGTLLPGTSATRPFTFTVVAGVKCGTRITPRFAVTASSESFGEVSRPMQIGAAVVAFAENFDGVSAPALPDGWTTAASANHQLWRTSSERQQSGSNSVFSPAPHQMGVNELVSPSFRVNTPNAVIKFRNWYELETTFLRNRLYDGAVMEVKVGDSEWQDILAAGGTFLSGGYDGTIDSCCSNPLGGRLGWSGRSGIFQVSEFIDTVAKLPASAAGQDLRLRWRVGTDIGQFREGQYIDNIVVTDGFSCQCGPSAAGPAPFDLDGDGKTDLSVAALSDSPGVADFRAIRSSDGTLTNVSFGNVGDVPAAADFDGDGKTDLAVFRPGTGEWWTLRSSDGTIQTERFGISGDVPLPDDRDGDGKADLVVYRGSTGTWYLRRSSDGGTAQFPFGLATDVPLMGDIDGDGRGDTIVFRPENGTWYSIRSSDGQIITVNFGQNGDIPVPIDHDGDGKTDPAVYRPATGTWYVLRSAKGFIAYQFGAAGDTPLQADFDGDGKQDIAVFRPASREWFYIGSGSGQVAVMQFGEAGDRALPGIFVLP